MADRACHLEESNGQSGGRALHRLYAKYCEVIDQKEVAVGNSKASCLLMAHRRHLRHWTNSGAFGAKRTWLYWQSIQRKTVRCAALMQRCSRSSSGPEYRGRRHLHSAVWA